MGPEILYTANSGVASIRLVLTMAAQVHRTGITTLDVAAAFLNTPMPKDDLVYAKPPNSKAICNWVDKNQVWPMDKAVYGLRASPWLWGQCRDAC